MRKSVTNLFVPVLLGVMLFTASCNEKDPLPISVSGFEVLTPNKLEKSVPVKFVNLSTNAESFIWDFGDGTRDSLNISPEHIYDDAGSYDVTLTAITQDGQESTEIKTVDIKTRVLVAFSVVNINWVNEDGLPWDDDDTGPDLVFAFGPQSAPSLDDYIITDTVKNVMPADFPLDWDFAEGDGLELNSELYDLVLFDADPEKAEDPKFDVMFGIELDPVTYVFDAKDENDQGLLQISIGGFAIDLYVVFDLQ
jgi:PKD repeat protein